MSATLYRLLYTNSRRQRDLERSGWRHELINRRRDEQGCIACDECKKPIEGELPTIHHRKPWGEIKREVMRDPEFLSQKNDIEKVRMLRDAYWDIKGNGANLMVLHGDCHKRIHGEVPKERVDFHVDSHRTRKDNKRRNSWAPATATLGEMVRYSAERKAERAR